MKPKILLLSLTLIISIASIHAKHVVLLKAFTNNDTECTGVTCECVAASNPYKWKIYYERSSGPFGPNYQYSAFYQMSKVITELSSEGFVLLTDKYHCPPGVKECTVRFDESNDFSVRSNYEKISGMSIDDWNNFLQKSYSPKVSTSWYECVFGANTTGYLAIHPMVERVLGWAQNQKCSTTWFGFYSFNSCSEPKQACVWLGKAPKINSADNTIEGERRCVTADDGEEALKQLNSKGKNVVNPRKYEIML